MRLITARKALALSARQMAERLLTPHQTYEQWERGKRRTPGVAVVAAESLIPQSPLSDRILALADGSRTIAEIAVAVQANAATIKKKLQVLRGEGHSAPVARRRKRVARLPRKGSISRRIVDLADGTRTVREIAGILGVPIHNVGPRIREMRLAGAVIETKPDRKGPIPGSLEAMERMRRIRKPLIAGSPEAMERAQKMREAKDRQRAP